jgi:hypothetical protein
MKITKQCLEQPESEEGNPCLDCPQMSECVTRLSTFWLNIIGTKQGDGIPSFGD